MVCNKLYIIRENVKPVKYLKKRYVYKIFQTGRRGAAFLNQFRMENKLSKTYKTLNSFLKKHFTHYLPLKTEVFP